jgi:DNA-binding PadR family transcriptional regulator
MFANPASANGIERLVRSYRRGMVNSLLEYLILNCIEKESMCGYDIITLLHERFHTLLSPGQVYPVIDQMTRQGLIEKEKQGRSVILRSSALGTSLLRAWRQEFHNITLEVHNLATEELIVA